MEQRVKREQPETLIRKALVSVALGALLFALSFSAEAQQPQKIPRIGFVSGDPGSYVDAFRQGLRNLGYIEGKNISIEYSNVEGNVEQIPTIVAELIRSKVD